MLENHVFKHANLPLSLRFPQNKDAAECVVKYNVLNHFI